MSVYRANLETIRNFNRTFPIGTLVVFQGRQLKTWGPAGIGAKGEPSIFLANGPDEPVPISQLQIPGYECTIIDRRKRPNVRPERA